LSRTPQRGHFFGFSNKFFSYPNDESEPTEKLPPIGISSHDGHRYNFLTQKVMTNIEEKKAVHKITAIAIFHLVEESSTLPKAHPRIADPIATTSQFRVFSHVWRRRS
jgi:hypothetical protein